MHHAGDTYGTVRDRGHRCRDIGGVAVRRPAGIEEGSDVISTCVIAATVPDRVGAGVGNAYLALRGGVRIEIIPYCGSTFL